MKSEKNAIEVSDVKLRYRCLRTFSIRQSLFSLKKSKRESFEALHGVSFEIEKGEIVRVIGRNRKWKVYTITSDCGDICSNEGSIELSTPSVSLLSIGVGFQRHLTGRENVMLSGMLLLAFKKKKSKRKWTKSLHLQKSEILSIVHGKNLFQRNVCQACIFHYSDIGNGYYAD